MRPLLARRVVFATLVVLASGAGAEDYKCHIGKQSYCAKYGGNLCEQWNSLQDRKGACERWTSGCITCHAAIPGCLGNFRPSASSPVCARCGARWHACMTKIDALYWPNRMSPRP